MLDRSEVLSRLNALDTGLLNRLYDYSTQIVIPESDLLINATMSTMKKKAFQIADAKFPSWTDRGSNDFGALLVEYMCLFSEKDFNYVNIYQREGHLATMAQYSNAYIRALELGYQPTLFKAANAVFSVTFSGGVDAIVAAGNIGVTLGVYTFTNTEDVHVAFSASDTVLSLTLYEGRWTTSNYEYQGTAIELLESNIDVSKLVVKVGTQVYTRVTYFGTTDAGSYVWYALPDEGGRVSIAFGDGVYGTPPNVGDIVTATYLVSASSGSKLVTSTTTQINRVPPNRNISGATLSGAVTQNVAQETLSSIAHAAPVFFRTRNRIIDTDDLINILLGQPDVSKASAFFFEGTFYFYVVPKNLSNLTILTDLMGRLNGTQIEGTSIQGLNTSYVKISPFSADLYILQGYSFEVAAAQAYTALSDFVSPLLSYAQLGKALNYYALVNHLISSVAGLQNAVLTQSFGLAPNYSGAQVIGKDSITAQLPAYVPVVSQSTGFYRIVVADTVGSITLNFYYAN